MNCALCDAAERLSEENLGMGWPGYLVNERDFYIFSSVSVPICESCHSRWAHYRDQSGYHGGAPPEDASELLDDLILENLIQLDDMGKKIEEADNAGVSGRE